jgi:hypothetical protein
MKVVCFLAILAGVLAIGWGPIIYIIFKRGGKGRIWTRTIIWTGAFIPLMALISDVTFHYDKEGYYPFVIILAPVPIGVCILIRQAFGLFAKSR